MDRSSSRALVILLVVLVSFVACSNPASGGGGDDETYTVSYFANGGSGEVPLDADSYAVGARVTLKGAGSLVKGTDQFAGWTTSLAASGRSCAAGAAMQMSSGGLSLYAVWIPVGLSFTGSSMGIELSGCGSASGEVTVPAGVNAIGYAAFSSSTITSVSLPPTLTYINGNAFNYCINLSSVTLSSSVKVIGAYAFSDCRVLTAISIPAGVTDLQSYAFYGCKALTAIDVAPANPGYSSVDGVLLDKAGATLICYPAGKAATSYAIPLAVTSIRGDAFAYATSLQSVTMPSGLASVAGNAFRYCTGLTSATIPASVSSITGAPFVDCSKLDFAVEASSSHYVVTGGVLLSKDGKTLIQYPQKSAAASYSVPSGVVDIADQAFVYCDTLTSLTLPSSVAGFGWSSFFGCSALATFYVEAANPPDLSGDTDPFSSRTGAIAIHVPSGSLGAYQAASGWNNSRYTLVSP